MQIDENLCTGCQLCVTACPYPAPQFNPETQKVSKCQMRYERQDMGMVTACVEACTTGALKQVDLDSFIDQNAVRSLKGFADVTITSPSDIFYPLKPKKRFFLT